MIAVAPSEVCPSRDPGVEHLRLIREPLAPERAKVNPLDPTKIDERALYRHDGKTCGFEEGSNSRNAIRVDVFVDWNVEASERAFRNSSRC